MKHLAAYLLLNLAGNNSPSASDIKSVLGSVGIDAEDDRLEKLLSELQGKDISELIAEGSTKLASVPSGGGGGGAAPAAGGAAAPSGGAAEEKKEEAKEEEKEESDEDMGFVKVAESVFDTKDASLVWSNFQASDLCKIAPYSEESIIIRDEPSDKVARGSKSLNCL